MVAKILVPHSINHALDVWNNGYLRCICGFECNDLIDLVKHYNQKNKESNKKIHQIYRRDRW